MLKQQKSCTMGKNASSTLPGRKLEKHVNNFDQYNAETDKQKQWKFSYFILATFLDKIVTNADAFRFCVDLSCMRASLLHVLFN